MRTRSKYLILISVIISLVVIQTVTYLFISAPLLKAKLLSPYFASHQHKEDSVVVVDHYTWCYAGSDDIYMSHNLVNDAELLKDKMDVKKVRFATESYRTGSNEALPEYNVFYNTWMYRADWPDLFDGYRTHQVEVLYTDSGIYWREVTYQWVLFFWIPAYEFFEINTSAG